MEYKASEVRTRLDSLLGIVIDDEETQKALSPDGDVPSQFLENNDIILKLHEFDNTGNSTVNNIDLEPPILFKYCSPDFFQQHPIDRDAFTHPQWAKTALHYAKFKKDITVMTRVNFVAQYLHRWAGGGGLPRKGVLPGALSIRELRGLVSVTGHHALYAGVGFSNNIGHQYNVWISEYDNKRFGGGSKPHLVLLGKIPDVGHEGSILFGELALLLTAMRNRAYQPAMFRYPDSDDDLGKEKDIPSEDEGFLFEDERRFPVLMVSIVGMQHARISYACMDGLKVVIRQSRIWSLEKKDEELFNFLSCFLLSEYLDENPVERLSQRFDSTLVLPEKESIAAVIVSDPEKREA